MTDFPTFDELFAHFLDDSLEPTAAVKALWDEVLDEDDPDLDGHSHLTTIESRNWLMRQVEPWQYSMGLEEDDKARQLARNASADLLPANKSHGFTPSGRHYVCRFAAAEQLKEAPFAVVLLKATDGAGRDIGSFPVLLAPDRGQVEAAEHWTGTVSTEELANLWKVTVEELKKKEKITISATGLTDADLAGLSADELRQLRDLESRLTADARRPMLQALLERVALKQAASK